MRSTNARDALRDNEVLRRIAAVHILIYKNEIDLEVFALANHFVCNTNCAFLGRALMIAAFRRQILCRRNYHVRSKSSVDLSGPYRTSRCKYCDIPMLKDIRSGWIVDALPSRTEQVSDIALAQGDGTLSAQTLHDTSGFPALKDIGQPNIIAASYDGENSYRFNAREMPNNKK